MNQILHLLNAGLTGLFNLLLLPFRGLNPLWGLVVISLIAGVVMLWIFGRVSDQDTIRRVRDQMRGNLLGIRLFGDDLRLLFVLQARVLRYTGAFLRHATVPILIMLVPVLLILTQLNLRYAVRPLLPGEKTVVTMRLADPLAMDRGVTLEAPDGVVVETAGVHMPSIGEVAWRVRGEQAGDYELTLRVGDETVSKRLQIGDGWGPTTTLRSGNFFTDLVLYPGEPPIESSSPVESISVVYPPLEMRLLGFRIDWLIAFFVLSILSGFAFKGLLGVEI